MLCSVPAEGKSAGGSNWLSRIRSSKGFPAGDDDDDLDHFLSQNPNSSISESTRPLDTQRIAVANPPEAPPPRIRDRVEPGWVGVMDTVLSELFFMGGSGEISSSRLSGKRIPRKQTNPRTCVASASNNNNNNNNNSNSNSSGVVEQRKKSSNFVPKTASLGSDSGNSTREGNLNGNVDVDVEDEEDEDEKQLKGYSRSEVTVIDTSCGPWKSEKLVFRRKNVWRVREKKVKMRSFGRKKRKLGNHDDDDHHDVCLASSDLRQSVIKPSSDEVKGQNSKNDSVEEICKGTEDNFNTTREVSTDSPNNVGQDFKKRSLVSSSMKKMKKEGSSVVLIKGIPTDKKNAAKLSKNCTKGFQKQNKT